MNRLTVALFTTTDADFASVLQPYLDGANAMLAPYSMAIEVFTTGGTVTHTAQPDTPDEMTHLAGFRRAVRTLVVRVVKAVGHSILDLKTSLLKPPLRHWASLACGGRRCRAGRAAG